MRSYGADAEGLGWRSGTWAGTIHGVKRGSQRTGRRAAWAAGLAAVVAILAGPAADWLRARPYVQPDGRVPDAVYLVCGARAQPRRLAALTGFLGGLPDERRGSVRILVGHDPQPGRWSGDEQRNLTRTEWSVKALRQAPATAGAELAVVPGAFLGTDGEMQALADFLRQHPDIHSVSLVTCPFHRRRVLSRFERYRPAGVAAGFLPMPAEAEDRYPWIVAAELAKLLRDAAGLARHPWLSR